MGKLFLGNDLKSCSERPLRLRPLEVRQAMGFVQIAAGSMVRSSYHADMRAKGEFKG